MKIYITYSATNDFDSVSFLDKASAFEDASIGIENTYNDIRILEIDCDEKAHHITDEFFEWFAEVELAEAEFENDGEGGFILSHDYPEYVMTTSAYDRVINEGVDVDSEPHSQLTHGTLNHTTQGMKR